MSDPTSSQQIAAVEAIIGELRAAAPAGFAIGLHIKLSTPSFMFQTYPADWMSHYTENGLVLQDPTVLWGFSNKGRVSWADLTDPSPDGVMQQAASFGLSHGMTLAFEDKGSLTIASFARSDRPFTPEESATLEDRVRTLHGLTGPEGRLDAQTAEALRRLSVKLTH